MKIKRQRRKNSVTNSNEGELNSIKELSITLVYRSCTNARVTMWESAKGPIITQSNLNVYRLPSMGVLLRVSAEIIELELDSLIKFSGGWDLIWHWRDTGSLNLPDNMPHSPKIFFG